MNDYYRSGDTVPKVTPTVTFHHTELALRSRDGITGSLKGEKKRETEISLLYIFIVYMHTLMQFNESKNKIHI